MKASRESSIIEGFFYAMAASVLIFAFAGPLWAVVSFVIIFPLASFASYRLAKLKESAIFTTYVSNIPEDKE